MSTYKKMDSIFYLFCYRFDVIRRDRHHPNLRAPNGHSKNTETHATHEKHDQIIQATSKYKIDLLGLADININYTQVGPTNQWKDRFKKLRTNSHCATNTYTLPHKKNVCSEELHTSQHQQQAIKSKTKEKTPRVWDDGPGPSSPENEVSKLGSSQGTAQSEIQATGQA
jgi:hypothetical protein